LAVIIKIQTGDRLKLKKPHPCGGSEFTVLRVGAQVRVVCATCQRDMTVDRIKLEKAIKQILPSGEESNEKGTNKSQ